MKALISKPIFLIFLIAVGICGFSGCKKNDPGEPGENEVFLLFKNFKPTQLVVKSGTTIRFISKDNATHTVSESSNVFDSGAIKSEGEFSYTFSTKGTFNIYCKSHSLPSETGTIVVE